MKYQAVGRPSVGVRLTDSSLKRILCVDDDNALRKTYQDLLKRYGEITLAENGRVALELFQESPQRYNLILTDNNMPEVEGIEFLAAIQSYSYPPRVLLTGRATPELCQRALELGAAGVLYKPLDPQMLLNIVKELLQDDKSSTLEQYVKDNFS
ncbi:TPA: response regulator [Candidatus Woesearchaeota archaeon]|nr:response regulator [Candidatus Woesearchaeota archaeon]HIG93442.1 response regulator [Candidatus Woesearchaeota archaeon]HIH12211.1 response regulator [Candidatus Woesearchaeota archaeon]